MKKFALLTFVFLSAITVSADNIEEVFVNMPDSIIPYLNMSIRTDMVDKYKSKTHIETKNLLDGESLIIRMADNYIDMQLNKVTSLSIAQLEKNDSTKILCLVKTYGNPAIESSVGFYTSDWKVIADNSFGLPDFSDSKVMTDMLTCCPDTMSTERFKDIQKTIEPAMVTATLSEDNTINVFINCPLLTKEENKALDTIKKQKSFKWDGNIFK